MRWMLRLGWVGVGLAAWAQTPTELDLQNLKQFVAAPQNQLQQAPDPTPAKGAQAAKEARELESARTGNREELLAREQARLEAELKALKARDRGPRRFAADFFEVRQAAPGLATDGGIAEDYVLGTGDVLGVNVFGSATFEVPAQVDGRGEVVIPKVGQARVGGLTLGRAKQVIQGLVGRNFSRATVDLQVIRLREIRVFVLGEVYRPGSYLVPSLSSLVNVLGLAGGPTSQGSYRDIRVMRGGRRVAGLDLYPLRAEGAGNPNVALQSGDTVFVPLAHHQVFLEGAFRRVVAQGVPAEGSDLLEADPLKAHRTRLEREIHAIEGQLAPAPSAPEGGAPGGEARRLSLAERSALEDRLQSLKRQLVKLKEPPPTDHRLRMDPATAEPFPGTEQDWTRPEWLRRWEQTGRAPGLLFEFLPGETVAEALRFAGGLAPEAGEGRLVLRHRDAAGVVRGRDVRPEDGAGVALANGDVLSAPVRRERTGAVVELAGWVRVPGLTARTEGLRVADLLKRDDQLLPDTYRARGEVLHTALDGTTRLQAFDVEKALAGDPAHNLLLEDRDRVELFRLEDLRLPRLVTVAGPVARPGTYAFHEGMRASDLLFRAGVPRKSADRLVAELAHSRDGKPSEVVRLDLGRLLSSEAASPVALLDDAVNPRVQPDDQLSVFEKPDYKVHRTVRISGQVARPGTYVLDGDQPRLSELIRRAGGLTPEAMPHAGIFLRRMGGADSALQRAAEESGLGGKDPTAKGINEILERLNETKRQPLTGALLKNPLLHGLLAGSLNRMVVDFAGAVRGEGAADVDLEDGDEVIIPRRTEAAYVVGETASPFATYKVKAGMTVSDLLKLAGGPTRNADTASIRLLKADGRILDSWLSGKAVEPGDTVLVPQRFRRDTSWQENLQALTPLALILNAIK